MGNSWPFKEHGLKDGHFTRKPIMEKKVGRIWGNHLRVLAEVLDEGVKMAKVETKLFVYG